MDEIEGGVEGGGCSDVVRRDRGGGGVVSFGVRVDKSRAACLTIHDPVAGFLTR